MSIYHNHRLLPRVLLICLCAGLPVYCRAQQDVFPEDDLSRYDEDVESWKFTEDVIDLPAYPEDDNLYELSIDTGGRPFEYLIDAKSLTIGADDVVYYTVVIRSRSGARNVFFESIRCDSGEYKTHAYGTSTSTFYRLYQPQWKKIYRSTGNAMDYRRDLQVFYFCDSVNHTLDIAEVMSRIQDSRNLPGAEGHF